MMTRLYDRLNRRGAQLTARERARLARMEALCRQLGQKYADDDLLELADRCYTLSAPIVVTR